RQVILDHARAFIRDEEMATRFHLAAIANNAQVLILDSTKPDDRGSELACYRLMVIADEYAGLLGQPYYEVADRASAIKLKHEPRYLKPYIWSDDSNKFAREVDRVIDRVSSLIDDFGINEDMFCFRLDCSLRCRAEDALMGEIAGVAFALSDYKRANGAYPESLEAIVPGVIATIPIDQVSGQVITYRRMEEGYHILVPARHGEQKEEVFWYIYE
ncbi:MAG: hypothetical protein WC655_09780, partial [Candidatus Hydrogenedentales bacterium]